MMRFSQIWDYVMRRKIQFFTPLIVFVLVFGFIFSPLFPQLKTSRLNATNSDNYEITYNNSLIFSLTSAEGKLAYSLEFQHDFQELAIVISPEKLSSEAYIRIFDEHGTLVQGEYTTIREPTPAPSDSPADSPSSTSEDSPAGFSAESSAGSSAATDSPENATADSSENPPIESLQPEPTLTDKVFYTLADAEKTYHLTVRPGYILEIHSGKTNQVGFFSTLDRQSAPEYAPTNETERYLITTSGLKKSHWSDSDAENALYCQLKRYLMQLISSYIATVDEDILNHKTADLAHKTQVFHAYQTLRTEDQSQFTEFIEHLRRGGSPVLTYSGPEQFLVGSVVDFSQYINIVDNEDGEISTKNLQISPKINWSEPGEYTLEFSARDSDGNLTTLSQKITLIATPDDAPSSDPDNPSDSPAQPDDDTSHPGAGDSTETPATPSQPGNSDSVNHPNDDNDTNQPSDSDSSHQQRPLLSNDPANSLGNLPSATPPTSSVRVPNTGESSSSDQVSPAEPLLPTGIGTNAPTDPETELSEPTQIWDNNQPTLSDSLPLEDQSPKAHFGWQATLFIVLGILLFLFLIKFIFDHYVR